MEGGNFLLKYFKCLDVNSGLKYKCDLIVKNSTECEFTANSIAATFQQKAEFLSHRQESMYAPAPIKPNFWRKKCCR